MKLGIVFRISSLLLFVAITNSCVLTSSTEEFPTPVPTNVVLETTPLPPLLPNSAKEELSAFVRNNGGCELPCLMGLTPGGMYESVASFGTYFTINTQQSDDQLDSVEIVGYLDDIGGGTLLVFWENRVRVQIGVGAYLTPDKEQIEHITLSASVYEHFEDDNGNESARLLHQHSGFDNLLKRFSLPTILNDYGKPSEIWIFPFPEDPGYSYESSTYPFVFILIYTDMGFAVEYIGVVQVEGENLVSCPDVDYMRISTWDPEMKKSINDVAQYFSGTDSLSRSNVSLFKPLQVAPPSSINDFYQTYKAGDREDVCIQTSKQFWP